MFRRGAWIGFLDADERWGEVQQERRVNTPTIVFAPSDTGKIGKVYSEQIHDTHAGAGRPYGRDRLEVRVVPVRGQEDELVDAMALPGREQIVQHPVKCLLSERHARRILRLRRGVHAVLDRGRPENAEFG